MILAILSVSKQIRNLVAPLFSSSRSLASTSMIDASSRPSLGKILYADERDENRFDPTLHKL